MHINQKTENDLKEALRCLHALSIASHENNYSTCGSYHIKPFNIHWDERTVREVAANVKIYIDTWIKPAMILALNADINEIDDTMRHSHERAVKARIEWLEKRVQELEENKGKL